MAVITTFGSPIRFDGDGDINILTDLDALKASIKNMIMLRIGEIIGLPKTGSRTPELLFDFRDNISLGLLKEYIRDAVREHVPKIFIKSIDMLQIEPTEKEKTSMSNADRSLSEHTFELIVAFSIATLGIEDQVQLSTGALV